MEALSAAKAREVADQCAPEDVIIGADTIVWVDGRPFGKPHSEEQAAAMLRRLSGDVHEVYTGVTVIRDGRERSEAERSLVRFRPLTEEEKSLNFEINVASSGTLPYLCKCSLIKANSAS